MSQSDMTQRPLPPCPVCGAAPQQRVWSSTYASTGEAGPQHIAIITRKRTPMDPISVRATPLICSNCGYVQFFVNPKYFRDTP